MAGSPIPKYCICQAHSLDAACPRDVPTFPSCPHWMRPRPTSLTKGMAPSAEFPRCGVEALGKKPTRFAGPAIPHSEFCSFPLGPCLPPFARSPIFCVRRRETGVSLSVTGKQRPAPSARFAPSRWLTGRLFCPGNSGSLARM